MALKIIITGASSGIGQALAKEYAKQGAVIGLLARRKEELLALQKILPCKSLIFPVDVTDLAQCRWAAEEFMALHGAPDIVIANAGISSGTLTENFSDLETFKKIIATNLIGSRIPFIPLFKCSKTEVLASLSEYLVLPVFEDYRVQGLTAHQKQRSLITWKVFAWNLRPIILM
jgi:NAD(P)-dependent dehydrogenase (short-subunit alcohol dehydrogenase family)